MAAATQHSTRIESLLDAVAERARGTGLFGTVTRRAGVVEAAALQCPEDAAFRIELAGDGLYVSWVTPDRYMSQSIEADLMWTGDDLSDMIDEELAAVGWNAGPLGKLEHFRNDEKLFTFRSKLPLEPGKADPGQHADVLVKAMMGYEAALRDLGDMKPEEDE